ncbi:APC family permease [Pseudorhodoferax soli]|uniref:Amino acid/polyamine/organocation transporter (APC superfamily) n=1 Tax=Pseudorhodoferax soli TaxID=545864 RepID=A0A368XLY9_9BURK|nr:amino acid permease [Pseudorhodoferax soli]RCW67497.1 amino acid/polyamine/organocation transporter (APC superfamily) [Pseudorhodoferax soli]
MTSPAATAPLTMRHAIAITVGVVIGAGIFKAPSLVAGSVPTAGWMFALWVAGGLIALVGALCYAELATTYPSAGGEYHFLSRAFGRGTALLYAWARFSVITTGSIALLGFVFGDYMTQLLPLGTYSSALWAAIATVVLTGINLRGIRSGAETQSWLTAVEVGGLVLIVAAALWFAVGSGSAPPPPAAAPGPVSLAGVGFGMVFVLLTFGGWNDAAYISADLQDRRAIARALLVSVLFLTALYLLVNWAYWSVLGLAGMAKSQAVATDVLTAAFGPGAGKLIAAMVAAAALTSINATMIVGARTASALGQDWPALKVLAAWDEERRVPRNALPIQCVLALLLIVLGVAFKGGFQAMVEYTAPVFWLFFLLVGIALFRLRAIDGARERPFRVPLYPVLPALFCASSAYMLWSSLGYVYSQQLGGFNAAWVGVGVLASGLVVLVLMRTTKD